MACARTPSGSTIHTGGSFVWHPPTASTSDRVCCYEACDRHHRQLRRSPSRPQQADRTGGGARPGAGPAQLRRDIRPASGTCAVPRRQADLAVHGRRAATDPVGLGRGRKGTIGVLADIGAHLGWALHMVPPYKLEGQVVSSTAIRTLLAAGAVRGVADLLGRNYTVSGVIEGDELRVDPERALPRPGVVYEAELRQNGASHEVQVTVQPTPGRVSLACPTPLAAGPAQLAFLRRES